MSFNALISSVVNLVLHLAREALGTCRGVCIQYVEHSTRTTELMGHLIAVFKTVVLKSRYLRICSNMQMYCMTC